MVTKVLAWSAVATAVVFVLLLLLPITSWDWLVDQIGEGGVRGWFKWTAMTFGWLSVLLGVTLLAWATLKPES